MKKIFFCLLSWLCLYPTVGKGQQNMQDYAMLTQSLSWIENMYVDSVDTHKLSEAAIRAMLKELDPHSSYMTAQEVNAMNENLGGNFEGIGIRYQLENDTVLVINTTPGGPSEKVGIEATDRIIMVNDSAIAGQKFDTNEIARRLRGPKGTHVKVSVLRVGESELIDFDIIRDKIPVNSVDAYYMVTPTIGFIKILRFAQSTADEVKTAMADLEKQGMKDLIIDLQDNGGGYLSAAVELAQIFLPAKKLVVYTKGRGDRQQEYSTGHIAKTFEGRLVVLIDEDTASASEIFSGAVQDYDRGVIVGRRSFGKGLVQRPVGLPGGSMLKLTVSHYYTPSGRCIQKPYVKGDKASYDKDIQNRLAAGELLSADSIHFADSLKCFTAAGRVVYGGGGIMPDFFVPLDTTKMTKSHRTIVAKGVFRKFVLDFYKEHQKQLRKDYPAVESYIEKYEIPDDAIAQLVERAKADSIQIIDSEIDSSKTVLKLQLKANVASDLYGPGSFARIMNQINPIFSRGVAVIKSDEYTEKLIQ